MIYCKRCLYPANHPLGLIFDEHGICSGCRIHEEKDLPGWGERLELLESIVAPYRSRKSSDYDCIVPVNGSRDSFFILHIVRKVLGLNPLLVSYNKHYNTETGFRNLSQLRTQLNSDILIMSTNPRSIRKINRETLAHRASMYWHVLAGESVFPVQTAVRFKIPLIIWGAHQGLDQVGMFSHFDQVEMTRKYRKEHDLMGLEAEDLLRLSEGRLSEKDLATFVYPSNQKIAAVGVRGIYLNNFIRWDTWAQHQQMSKLYGEQSRSQLRTFDSYNDVDSHHFNGIHDYLKFLKWGFGRVTDHATREIRLRRMDRPQAIALVKQYQSRSPADLGLFLKWMDMSESEFYSLVNVHRSEDVWAFENSNWQLLDDVTRHESDAQQESASLGPTREILEIPSESPNIDPSNYVTIGRGWSNSSA